ncbi:MAG: transcription antitermination factor NusB [Candidatus Sericytochromatia bacterium]|nr:transcription antitermination factor NusB [Candidatus Sericytochromatia bacterium]
MNPVSETLNIRRLARELALLSMAQLGPLPAEVKPELEELVTRAAHLLSAEARDRVEEAAGLVDKVRLELSLLGEDDAAPRLLAELARHARKDPLPDPAALEEVARAFWNAARDLDVLDLLKGGIVSAHAARVLEAADAMDRAADLVGEALDWPEKAAIAGGSKVRAFAIGMLRQYLDHAASIDAAIDGALEHWSIERLAAVDRDLLRLAVAEIRHAEDIPLEVAINEAVELAKRYGTEESGRFVNGVLARFAQDRNGSPRA